MWWKIVLIVLVSLINGGLIVVVFTSRDFRKTQLSYRILCSVGLLLLALSAIIIIYFWLLSPLGVFLFGERIWMYVVFIFSLLGCYISSLLMFFRLAKKQEQANRENIVAFVIGICFILLFSIIDLNDLCLRKTWLFWVLFVYTMAGCVEGWEYIFEKSGGEHLGIAFLLLLCFQYVGGFYSIANYKLEYKLEEMSVKSCVKNYLNENSNDGKIDIVSWNNYYASDKGEYSINVTVRLKNDTGNIIIKTFVFYLKKDNGRKRVVGFKTISTGSILCINTLQNHLLIS